PRIRPTTACSRRRLPGPPTTSSAATDTCWISDRSAVYESSLRQPSSSSGPNQRQEAVNRLQGGQRSSITADLRASPRARASGWQLSAARGLRRPGGGGRLI